MNIIFTNTLNASDKYNPTPASEHIPDWYKETKSYRFSGEKKPIDDGSTPATIKRCMPVFDVMTAGYILYTYTDVWVTQRDGHPYYQWPSFEPIQFHPIDQAPEHPNKNGHKLAYPKWMNPWSIKTPSGYSVMFIPPTHREAIFTILPGIVDTDTYDQAVNFPFVLNDINFEGLIPAGTPMVQVIPFKRESWKMQLGGPKDFARQNATISLLKSKFFDSYKMNFRQYKEYK